MQETARRNTRQKAAIERAVLSSCDHPSAETVYERVREELPAVSLGTVYRVLRALVEPISCARAAAEWRMSSRMRTPSNGWSKSSATGAAWTKQISYSAVYARIAGG